MLRKQQPINNEGKPDADSTPAPTVSEGGYSGPERRKTPRHKTQATDESVAALQAEFERWAQAAEQEQSPQQPSVTPAQAAPRQAAPAPAPSAPAPTAPASSTSTSANPNARLGLDSIQSDLRWTISDGPREQMFGRMRFTSARAALILVALLAGGTAAFLVTQRDTPEPVIVAEPEPTIVTEPRTRILVANRTIHVGERLVPDALEWKEWPEASVDASFINIEDVPEARTGMTGSLARYEIFPGEPLREDKIVRSDQGFLPAVLEDGMRAVSVVVSADAASGGFIGPNDRVDVVLTHPPSHDETTNNTLLANTILHNVQVLALNGQLSRTPREDDPDHMENGAFSGNAMATLALDPDQSKVIIHAASVGKLSLVLRSIGDFAEGEKPQYNSANAAIRISSPFWNN